MTTCSSALFRLRNSRDTGVPVTFTRVITSLTVLLSFAGIRESTPNCRVTVISESRLYQRLVSCRFFYFRISLLNIYPEAYCTLSFPKNILNRSYPVFDGIVVFKIRDIDLQYVPLYVALNSVLLDLYIYWNFLQNFSRRKMKDI